MVKIIFVLCLAVLLPVPNGFAQSNNSSVLLYSQTDLGIGYPVFSNDFGVGHENLNQQAADDFIVDAEWVIDQIIVTGIYEDDNIYAEGFNIYIYADDNNTPGLLVYYGDNQTYTQNGPSGNIIFTIDLQNPVVLTSGHYWLSVQAQMNWNTMPWEFWYWNQISGSFSYIAKYQNPGGFWPQGCLSWNIIPDCFQGYTTQTDMYFELYGEFATPVELTSFSAIVSNDNVELSWITATETNNRGFEIERSQMSEVKSQMDWEKIGFVEGHGTTTESQTYSFADKNVVAGKYNYKLKQIDYDGTFEYSNVIEVKVTSPSTFSLEQNYPNPFNPSTIIGYQLPVSSDVTLKVYDVLGNEVATLVDEYKPAGNYEIEFNGHSDEGQNLTSGIYFYQLRVRGPETSSGQGMIETKKMVLLK